MNDGHIQQALRSLLSDRTQTDVLQTTLRALTDHVQCDSCYILSVDGTDLTVHSQAGEAVEYESTSTHLIQDLARTAATQSTASIINDLTVTRSTVSSGGNLQYATNGKTLNGTESPTQSRPRSLLIVPFSDQFVLQAMDRMPNTFSESDLDYLQKLLSYTSEALERFDKSTKANNQEPYSSSTHVEIDSAVSDTVAVTPLISDGDGTNMQSNSAEIEQLPEAEALLEYIDGIVHDMRNPLTIAKGHTELILEEPQPEGINDELQLINDALRRLEGFVNNLDSLKEGGLVTDIESVELEELAHRAWTVVPTGSAELVVDSSGTFLADPDACARLLENLFRNAGEHGASDVTVRVGVMAATDGIYITDDGSGIDPDAYDQIFEMGYSTGDSDSGIGLAIVNAIVNHHGWDIAVMDSAEGGARFEITGIDRID